MRLIDADELMEHVWRDKLDSRELIAKMIDNAPTVKMERQANNFIKIETGSILKLHVNIPRLFTLLDAFVLIIGICKDAKYPEDLEEIYEILNKYIPDWQNKDWRLDV